MVEHHAGRAGGNGPFALLGCLALLIAGASAPASDPVVGAVTRFDSPRGLEETCIALAPMPGALYSAQDRAQERALCGIDLYAPDVGVCPKLVSTSPGTFVYDLRGGPYAGQPTRFEAEVCPRGDVVVDEAAGPPAYFKITMNGQETSATFSTASLLYYHFSRYLNGTVHVPVSVYRSIDRAVHEQRVTRRGLELSAGRSALRMNHAAWKELDAVEKGDERYVSPAEIFTGDGERIHGILLHVQGRRYGAEVNGTRRSGWGDGQNRDFQQTAPYLALREDAPLLTGIERGLRTARQDSDLNAALGSSVAPSQMAFWMQDLTEIVWLDYVFSQQDRVGNIDYVDSWHWLADGELLTAPAHTSDPPSDIARLSPVKIRRTWLNDNDAGGKRMYRNYAKRTGMLEGLRHFNPETYRRVVALADDLSSGGEMYDYVRETFGLSDVQRDQLVGNAAQAADILRSACRSGQLRFDLDPVAVLSSGQAPERPVDCENP